MAEKIEPIIISNPETGESYTIEYNRASAKAMERETGVNLLKLKECIEKAPMDTVSNLFYYGLQMHHADEITHDEADEILFDQMGFPDGFIEDLAALYAQAYASMNVATPKNAKWVVKK